MAAVAVTTTAWAHGFIVLGTLSVTPDPPRAHAPMTLRVQLQSTTEAAVSGAKMLAILRSAGAPQTTAVTLSFTGVEDAGGSYVASGAAPDAGAYTLTMEDHTYPGEHASTQVAFTVGGTTPNGALGFAFPPTVRASLLAWLLWLVALPLAAAAVVWWLVRRSRPRSPCTSEHPAEG